MQETGIPGENQRPVVSHWQTLSHDVVSSAPRLSGIRSDNIIVVIYTDCIGSYKSTLAYDHDHDGQSVLLYFDIFMIKKKIGYDAQVYTYSKYIGPISITVIRPTLGNNILGEHRH